MENIVCYERVIIPKGCSFLCRLDAKIYSMSVRLLMSSKSSVTNGPAQDPPTKTLKSPGSITHRPDVSYRAKSFSPK